MATAPKVECLTPGQMKDLCSAAGQVVPNDFPRDLADLWIGQKGVMGDKFREILHAGPFPDINWPSTYSELDMRDEYEEAVRGLASLPENPCIWVVPMVKGITPSRVVRGYHDMEVQVYIYLEDLDADIVSNDRDPNRDGSYFVCFQRTIEADKQNKNLSANELAEREHQGITLCERLISGFGFYATNNQHLDQRTRTLCSGSRYRVGSVPFVDWDSGGRGVCVGWCDPGHADGCLRSRSVVSLPAKQA